MRKFLIQFTILLMVYLLLQSCGHSESEDSSTTSAKTAKELAARDFQRDGTDLTVEQLKRTIQSTSFFQTKNAMLDPELRTCIATKTSDYVFSQNVDLSFTIYIPPIEMKDCYATVEFVYDTYMVSQFFSEN